MKKVFPLKTNGYIVTKRNKRIFHDTVKITLRNAGFISYQIYNDEMDSQINLLLNEYPKLELRFLAMSIGQTCNINSRDCRNFSPYTLRENMGYLINQVKRDLDRVLNLFCEIDTFHIHGGEPFLIY